MKQVYSFLENFVQGIYPSVCKICRSELAQPNETVCGVCIRDLPLSHTGAETDAHPILELFYGRIPINHAFALYGFEKETVVQKLLHQIKYKDQPSLARYMGELMGEQLILHPWFEDIDALLPVPIHPKKRFIRGYNQSEELAEGIRYKTNKMVDCDLLQRTMHNESQTKQGRFNRWENIQNAFKAQKPHQSYKHVGLVDDVITTGSTLEKIATDLRSHNPEIKISVLTLALAK